MKATFIIIALFVILFAAGLADFSDGGGCSPRESGNTIEIAKSKQIAEDLEKGIHTKQIAEELEKGIHTIKIDGNEYIIVVGQTGIAICQKSKNPAMIWRSKAPVF